MPALAWNASPTRVFFRTSKRPCYILGGEVLSSPLYSQLPIGSLAGAQDSASDLARLVEVLRVAPGQVLADIGAGPGALLTIPMAKAVGPSGKVYETDLGRASRTSK